MEIVQPHFGEAFMEISSPIPIILIIYARDYLFAALINIAILAIKLYPSEAFTEIISIIIYARDYLFATLVNKPPLFIALYTSEAFIETTTPIIFARDNLLAALITNPILFIALYTRAAFIENVSYTHLQLQQKRIVKH